MLTKKKFDEVQALHISTPFRKASPEKEIARPVNSQEEPSWFDKSKSLDERKQLYAARTHKKMNPIPADEFDPENWEPMGPRKEAELAGRPRKKPVKKLPTHNINPKEIREGQMIGMYESKQDLYLMFAHRCNEMQDEIDALRAEVDLLKKDKK